MKHYNNAMRSHLFNPKAPHLVHLRKSLVEAAMLATVVTIVALVAALVGY